MRILGRFIVTITHPDGGLGGAKSARRFYEGVKCDPMGIARAIRAAFPGIAGLDVHVEDPSGRLSFKRPKGKP